MGKSLAYLVDDCWEETGICLHEGTFGQDQGKDRCERSDSLCQTAPSEWIVERQDGD